jgi:hypothetical protein
MIVTSRDVKRSKTVIVLGIYIPIRNLIIFIFKIFFNSGETAHVWENDLHCWEKA